jgi:glycine/D-amino acid oxidase-like deaminating enzyme
MADQTLLDLGDLRSGRLPWPASETSPDRDFPDQILCDVAVVGAGITGAFIAERLTRRGLKVVVLDRHAPERASTAASTALLLWELDTPLVELAEKIGFDAAAGVYGQSCRAVAVIAALVRHLGISCGFVPRDSLYLSGDRLDGAAMREEHAARRAAGLAGRFLTEGEVARAGFRAAAAICQGGAAEADPVALTDGLMRAARSRGAALLAPVTALAYDASAAGVSVATDRGGAIHAKALILATGYDMPSCVPAGAHRLLSTWAIGTTVLPPPRLWPERRLVWEASDPYLYLRTTSDGRILAGGADEAIADPAAREALLPAKAAEIRRRVAARWPAFASCGLDLAWSGLFGAIADGMPLIGPVPSMPGCYAAFGYAGNGITFSAIAAAVIDRMLRGEGRAEDDAFALDRAA